MDAGEELLDGFASAVGDAAQERRQADFGEPGRGHGDGIAAQERDRHVGVQSGEQADGAGKDALELRLQLVDQTDPGLDQLFAGSGQGPQHRGGVAVLGQGAQPVSVGAQHVGEQVGVGGVGLGPGAACSGCAAP